MCFCKAKDKGICVADIITSLVPAVVLLVDIIQYEKMKSMKRPRNNL